MSQYARALILIEKNEYGSLPSHPVLWIVSTHQIKARMKGKKKEKQIEINANIISEKQKITNTVNILIWFAPEFSAYPRWNNFWK